MKFEINKQSSQPIHLQLREQIIFRISSRELPIGFVMPSCRALGHKLGISSNTVLGVYKALVDERWLVKRRGTQHVVVQRKTPGPNPAQINNIEELIDHTIQLAHERGYSLQQLAARFRERMLEQPPDHLLIIEPEKEMGELMREEMRRSCGQAPAGCSVSTLRQKPTMAIGAVLLTPSYLEDGLECLPFKGRRIVPLHYLQVDQHLDAVRNLTHPSSVAFVSISPAALKTASGLLAPVVGERHTLHEYLMQSPIGKEGPRFHEYSVEEDYPNRQPVRKFDRPNVKTDVETSAAKNDPPQSKKNCPATLSSADLKHVDVLFCDSIAYAAIKHPRRIRCQLLSDESLAAVAAAAKSLVQQ